MLMLALAGAVFAQAQAPARYRPERHLAPYLNLTEARTVATRYAGESAIGGPLRGSQTRALSTATGDFDEDGMPDLAAGFATAGGAGAVSVHRGNVDALWPYGALRGTEPPAFLPEARVFALPEAPDFLAAGDFDADGHWDIVAARAGGTALYFLKGDGHGGFADAQRMELAGSVTAMTSGEINRADGLTDLMIAVTGSAGPRALVFASPAGALRGKPEAFSLPAEASALAVMPLDGGVMNGLAVAAGHDLLLIHGRDRRLTRSQAERDGVAAATVTRQSFSFGLQSLAVGHFTSPTQDLAALGDDGQIHILERSDANQPVGTGEAQFSLMGRGVAPARPRALRPAGLAPKTTGVTERKAIALPAGAGGVKLVTARVAASGRDSLIALDAAGKRLHVVSHSDREDALSMGVSASLNVAAGAPAAVQPMRINKDAFSDLVVLAAPQAEPIVIETSPDFVLVVTNTADTLPSGGSNSLREALAFVNTVGGNDEIDFDIPVTDPNRDPTTGVFTIQEIGLSDIEALPNLGTAVLIDGYTQPGASPNTLVNGDNAQLLIDLNGSMAGSGPSGLQIFADGCTIRGIAFNNFVQAPIPGVTGQTHGGAGIDIESSGNIIEGNFIGLDAGGTFIKPSYLGILSFGGENGDVIGGATPQARNIVSGNYYAGIALQQSALVNSYLVQGNYVGTDRTGTQALPNNVAGVGLEGLNVVLGGATAGARNVIVSNGYVGATIQKGCGNCLPAQGNLVQGNYIGTDLTGAARPFTRSGEGVSLSQSTGDTVGGTTPAARNIISGARGDGVDLFGGNEDALIEGNYIGVDATGSHAVGNGGAGVNFGTAYYDLEGSQHSGGPAVNNLIGGEAPGAGNVISGNAGAGVNLTSLAGYGGNNVIAGNLIGTDASGVNPLGNTGDGVLAESYANTNTIGGTDPEAANTIAYNSGNGVRVDPGYPNTTTYGPSYNSVIGNAIYSNTGAGVRIPTGTGNVVSRNSIYSNGALGIDIDAAGVLVNSACQANTAGANALQNSPVLTAGAGATLVSATATDPNGNTSEFSNCVATSLSGNILNIAGTLNSLPSTTYTIEYFSNTACDASGHGQGKVYLGSTTVTTASSCTATLNNSLNLTTADLGVTNTAAIGGAVYELYPVPSVVTNHGPIAATGVTWTDVLPAGVNYQSVTTTQGSCNFAAGAITCNLGTLPPGGTVEVTAGIVFTATGPYSNTVSVASSTPDGNAANNSATVSGTMVYDPYLASLSPPSVYAGSPNLPLTLVGAGFTPTSQVTFGGVTYPATFTPNWTASGCGGTVAYCTALTITAPSSQLTTVANVPVTVVTTGIGAGSQTLTFYVNAAPVVIGPVTHFVLSGIANPVASGSLQLLYITAEDANGNTVPSYLGTVNLTSSDPAPTVFTAGGGTASVTFTANERGVADTITALQTVGTQSITATDASNPTIKGTLSGIVVSNGPASNLALTGTPQATPPGHPFALPLSVTVTDEYGNPVPNQLVTFTAPATGASAVLSSKMATTNSLGVASITASANGTAGAYEVGVTFGQGIAGGGDNADVFLLTNGTGLATLTATAGTPQTTFTGQLFKNSLQATLVDGLGNPISGATVYFTSGSVNGANAIVTASAVTNASGVATSTANAPLNANPGTFPVTASVGGLAATFTLTELTPQPVVMTITGGSPQSTTVGTAFAKPLAVHVADGFGTARPGVVVTYIPPTAGATAAISAGTASTDSSGNASLTAAANSTLGTYNVMASVGGVSVNFVLTNGPTGTGPPASIATTTGTPQSQSVGKAFLTAMQVVVKDGQGNPLGGTSVTFSAPLTGASGTFANSATVSVTTNANGLATAPAFTANTVTGSYQVTATAGTVSTTFNLTNLPGTAAAMNILVGNNQSATINTDYGTALEAQLVDAYGNPAGAVGEITFIVEPATGGASGTFAGSIYVYCDSNGISTAPALLANGTAGAFGVLAYFFNATNGTQQYQVFNLTNTTSVPAAVTAVAGTPQSTTAGTAFETALAAKVTDAGSNPLAGFTVTFTAPSTGASAVFSSASAITNASGIAAVNAVANGFSGSYPVTASVGGHSASFALTNNPARNKCDVNRDTLVNVADVQLITNEALGTAPAVDDLNQDGVVNIVDVQIVVNAVLGLGCAAK
jgi:hypothetical protein